MKKFEIKIENVCQKVCWKRALVAHASSHEEEQISSKSLNVHDENELVIKFVSFEWTSSTRIINVITIDCCEKEDLKFEVLKGVSVKDLVEHEHELASVK